MIRASGADVEFVYFPDQFITASRILHKKHSRHALQSPLLSTWNAKR